MPDIQEEQRSHHAYDAAGTYVGRLVATDAELIAEGLTSGDAPAGAVSDPRFGVEVPRTDFAENAAEAGLITWAEAAAWAAGNTLPQIAQDLIDEAPEPARDRLMFILLAKTSIRRLAPQIEALQLDLNLTDEEVDALFVLRNSSA